MKEKIQETIKSLQEQLKLHQESMDKSVLIMHQLRGRIDAYTDVLASLDKPAEVEAEAEEIKAE